MAAGLHLIMCRFRRVREGGPKGEVHYGEYACLLSQQTSNFLRESGTTIPLHGQTSGDSQQDIPSLPVQLAV